MNTDPPSFASDLSFVPDELGWAWAAHLQHHAGGQWLVRWESGSQRFTAAYLGETAEDGGYRKALTPQGLWERILAFDALHPLLDLGSDHADDAGAWQPRIGSMRHTDSPWRAG
ncbi:hypothetical protein ACIBQ6_34740 [Nonomuraea sp. NPDC049655]|uniref:hypothetical protein n=1 Tax=Nonomuraea sp. NPDC049655 TaxID=3364355 RepID=UPI00378B3324